LQDYRNLVVWQRSHVLVLSVYAETAAFPEAERFGLTSQMRRAAVSIPSNIAEGCGRETNAELRRFLYVAMGSASELEYQLYLANELHFMPADAHDRLKREIGALRRMLNTLIQRITSNHDP